MPSTGLTKGPYTLTSQNIDGTLTRTSPGCYALGYIDQRGAFVVGYVGRSDDDVNGRLHTHVGAAKYSHFKADYATSAKDAFLWECRMFHDFSGLDNVIHPARPVGSGWKCPRCSRFG